jgi:hypothetical protein
VKKGVNEMREEMKGKRRGKRRMSHNECQVHTYLMTAMWVSMKVNRVRFLKLSADLMKQQTAFVSQHHSG